MIFDITSLQNPRIKHVVKLREDKRQRQRDQLFLVEGRDELDHAFSAGFLPQTIFTAPDLTTHQLTFPATETIRVNRTVFGKISYRENPDGWLGIFPIPSRSLDNVLLSSSPLLIIAESVEKPGNLGAILRTADAARADALLLCDPRVDLWNPNVVRASRGALFSVPAVEVNSASALAWLKARRIQILAATPAASVSYTSLDYVKPVAIAVGTEDTGLSEFWLEHADEKMSIPMLGRVNSLNVSIATAVIIYEAIRQRRMSQPFISPG